MGLGDSLAFGYTRLKFEENFPTESPTAFERGYVNFFYEKVKASSVKFGKDLKGLKLVNNGCPGETTDSFIGNNPLGLALDGAEAESPCAYHKAGFPLHHEYGVGQSQLENALQVNGEAAAKGETVEAITLNIGANDELRTLHKCEKEVTEEYEKTGKSKYGGNPSEAVRVCVGEHTKETIEHIVKNIGTIVFVLDEGSKFGSVNYTGNIDILLNYNPDTFVLLGSDKIQVALNEAIEANIPTKFPNVTTGNPFKFFNPQNNGEGSLKEENRICLLTEMCRETGKANNPKGDIHPTERGYKELNHYLFLSYNPAL